MSVLGTELRSLWGTYALISQDENRFQKLQLRKPSVRKKLQEQSAAVKPPKKSAVKDQER